LYQQHMGSLQEKMDERAVDAVSGDEVREVLASAALTAARRNVTLMESENERIAQASVWDILDRTGYPKAQRTDVHSDARVMLDEDSARALGEALRECTPRDVPSE